MEYEISKEAAAEAKKTYPEAKRFTMSIRKQKIEVICRMPSRIEWRKFKTDILAGGQASAGAQEQLFINCCVYPKPAELDGLLSRYPAAADVFGVKLRELAGSSEEVAEADL